MAMVAVLGVSLLLKLNILLDPALLALLRQVFEESCLSKDPFQVPKSSDVLLHEK